MGPTISPLKGSAKSPRQWQLFALVLTAGSLALSMACNSSQFASSSGKKAAVPANGTNTSTDKATDAGNGKNGGPNSDSGNKGGDGSTTGDKGGANGSGGDKGGTNGTGGDSAGGVGSSDANLVDLRSSVPLATSQTQNSVWVVTSDGNGAKILLDAANNYPMTTFTGTGGGSGHRTFVSPYGLFVGTTAGSSTAGGKVYFMPNTFKTGDAAQVAVDLNGYQIGGGSRICVSVFTLNDIDYLGAAFTNAGGARAFFQAPIDPTKPGFVDTSKGKVVNAGAGLGEWGYSCYTDRLRNYFWSKNNAWGGNISGVNLATGAALPVTSAPNGKFTMKGPGNLGFNLASTTQSYAMGGAVDGSLLSGVNSANGVYNMANEPLSGMVITSTYGGNPLYLLSATCFTTTADCSGAAQSNQTLGAAYDASGAGYIGPMSSLNDGRVLGLERGATKSSVYLMSLVDPQSLAKGLVITKIKEVPGDSYMYSDFTGSMSLAASSTKTIDLTQVANFKAGAPFRAAFLSWTAEAGSFNSWIGLTLNVVCFKQGATPGAPGAIGTIPVAGTEFDISSAPGCNGNFDQVQITVAPEKPNTLVYSKTTAFKFHGQQ